MRHSFHRPFAAWTTRRSALLLLIAAGFFSVAHLLAADYMSDWARLKRMTPRQYLAHYTSTPIQIDGSPSEAAWRLAPWTEDFADIEGGAKPKPRFRTRAKMLWDDQFFY